VNDLRGGVLGPPSPTSKGSRVRYVIAGKWSRPRFTIEDDEGKTQFEVVRIYGLDGNSLSLRDPAITS